MNGFKRFLVHERDPGSFEDLDKNCFANRAKKAAPTLHTSFFHKSVCELLTNELRLLNSILGSQLPTPIVPGSVSTDCHTAQCA